MTLWWLWALLAFLVCLFLGDYATHRILAKRRNGAQAARRRMLKAKLSLPAGQSPAYEDFSACSPPPYYGVDLASKPDVTGLYEAREEFYREDDQELAAADSIKLTPELEAWAESSKHR